jgi:hypothetical protein
MTTNVLPSRPARGRALAPAAALRLLWIEIKRNAVPWVLPLLAAVFCFDTLRTADGFPPVWTLRASAITDHMLFEFSVFAGGLAAWAGSREGRRKTLDLVETTCWDAWRRLSIALAATLGWLLLAFGSGVAVLYIQTALQATWGGPPLWPVFVGAAGVIVVAVIGFTSGVLFPGRFTAPLVAIGVLVLDQIGFREVLSATGTTGGPASTSGMYALLSPSGGPPSVDSGVYYHVAPDVPIVQIMFMGGIGIALFGVLGLAPVLRRLASAPGWPLRAVAVILVGCGVAASVTGFTLAGTAKSAATGGWEIPALHSAASDRPVPYTPDCASVPGLQVCVHPAFSFYLSDVAAAFAPVAAEIRGLPGAPVRAEEVASVSGGKFVVSSISGNPPVFEFSGESVGGLYGGFNGIADPARWRAGFQQGLLDAFVSGPLRTAFGGHIILQPGAAQQAVADGLLIAVGSQPASGGLSIATRQAATESSAAISTAASRFTSLPESARHAWLLSHLAALRAGEITLEQLP